ncbi:MAG: hypothetical protein IPJ31_05080 [Bacteroidetes bacterium]|nr:hypothetical protein [Bacteroidota bacterium]
MSEAGYHKTDIEELSQIDFTTHLVFSIGMEPQKIDFLPFIDQIDYEQADKNKEIGEMDDMLLPVIHLHDLVLSKMNTGRIKDQADIEELQKINKQ